MLLILLRTLILYLITLFAIRIMGKREVGQLQPFELTVLLIISEMAAIAMQDGGVPLANSIAPILFISILQIGIAIFNMKNERIRSLFCGSPTIVIEKGRVREDKLRDLRMNMSDLSEQLRTKGYFDLNEINYAIMEPNGQLSVLPRASDSPPSAADLQIGRAEKGLSLALILDGKINHLNLRQLGRDEAWLRRELARQTESPPEEVFLFCVNEANESFLQLKETVSRQKRRPEQKEAAK